MIDVQIFATLRDGREKKYLMNPDAVHCARDVMDALDIREDDVAILLINGFHAKPDAAVNDGDIVALFPPTGGG